jgi:hypothetical protein
MTGMREFVILLVHLIVTLVRLAKPGGLRSVLAESVMVRNQQLILNRGRKGAPTSSTPVAPAAFLLKRRSVQASPDPSVVGGKVKSTRPCGSTA